MDLARSRGWPDHPFPSDKGHAVTGESAKSWGAESPASYADHTMTGKELPRLGIAGISTATFIELAKVVVEITKKRHAMKELREGHDLAFIIDANKRLG